MRPIFLIDDLLSSISVTPFVVIRYRKSFEIITIFPLFSKCQLLCFVSLDVLEEKNVFAVAFSYFLSVLLSMKKSWSFSAQKLMKFSESESLCFV